MYQMGFVVGVAALVAAGVTCWTCSDNYDLSCLATIEERNRFCLGVVRDAGRSVDHNVFGVTRDDDTCGVTFFGNVLGSL